MATLDRRRNNGPVSQPPIFAITEDIVMSDSPSNLAIFLQTGMIAHANGSAYFEQSRTKLIVSVHGPRAISQAATAGVQPLQVRTTLQSAPGTSQAEEKTLGGYLGTALSPSIIAKRYPKSEIAITVQVLESESWSTTLAGAITASSAALADAGIEVHDLVAAVSLQESGMVVASMPNRQEVTLVKLRGEVQTQEEVDEMMKVAVKQTEELSLIMNKVLLQ